MRYFLAILSGIVFLIALTVWATSETIFQQISAGIIFIIWAIFLSTAAIVDAIVILRKSLKK